HMQELSIVNSECTTIMLVTHDVKVAAKCTRVLYIVDGNIKGEYNLERYTSDSHLRERERSLSNWLMEMGW
ncbi:MAG: ABC transporter ATP-binding protein, partial [Oscillospiraceae bacterium]|nr:ABC transporter ATP-binding protein [Oscillospiraceae bacterium]